MLISLILTPFDHFHFHQPLGLLSSQDLTACPRVFHNCIFSTTKKVHSSINQESILRTIWGLKTAEFAYKVAPLESVGGPKDPKMDH